MEEEVASHPVFRFTSCSCRFFFLSFLLDCSVSSFLYLISPLRASLLYSCHLSLSSEIFLKKEKACLLSLSSLSSSSLPPTTFASFCSPSRATMSHLSVPKFWKTRVVMLTL